MTIITPRELAYILDIEETEARSWLRHFFPDSAPGKGGRWMVTPRMARQVARMVRADAVRSFASRAA